MNQLSSLQQSNSSHRQTYPQPIYQDSLYTSASYQAADNKDDNLQYENPIQQDQHNYLREVYIPSPFPNYASLIQYGYKHPSWPNSVQEEFEIQSMDGIDDTDVASDDTVQHESSEQYLPANEDSLYQDTHTYTDPSSSISDLAARFNPFGRH